MPLCALSLSQATLLPDSRSILVFGGFDGKQKGSGMQYAQPVILTNDGQTRVVFGSGKRDTCGALADRFRMGEQIKWTPWGQIAQIVRVEKPLASHFEWVSFFQMANFAGVKKYLDKEADYYVITHTLFPESPAAPCFNAMKFSGQEDVFKRLDNEMSRQGGNISCISPTFTGDKLKDLRMRRAVAIDAAAHSFTHRLHKKLPMGVDNRRSCRGESRARETEMLGLSDRARQWLAVSEQMLEQLVRQGVRLESSPLREPRL